MKGHVNTEYQQALIDHLNIIYGREWFNELMSSANDACVLTNAQYWFTRSSRSSGGVSMYIRFMNVQLKSSENRRDLLRIPDIIYHCSLVKPYISATHGTMSLATPSSFSIGSPHPHMTSDNRNYHCGICFGSELLNNDNNISDPALIGMFIMRMHAHATSFSREGGPFRDYTSHRGQAFNTTPTTYSAYRHSLATFGAEYMLALEDLYIPLRQMATCKHSGVRLRAKKVIDVIYEGKQSYGEMRELMTFLLNEIMYSGITDDVDISKSLSEQFQIQHFTSMVVNLTGVEDRSSVALLTTLACRGTCMAIGNGHKIPIWTNPIRQGSASNSVQSATSTSVDAYGNRINVTVVPYMDDYGDDLQLIPTTNNNEQTKEKVSFNQIDTVWDVSYSSLIGIEGSIKKVLQRNHRKIRIKQLALDCIEASGGSVPALVRKTRIGGMVGSFIVEASSDRAEEIAGAVRKLRECGKRIEKYRHVSRPNIALFYRRSDGQWDFRHNWTDASIDRLFPVFSAQS